MMRYGRREAFADSEDEEIMRHPFTDHDEEIHHGSSGGDARSRLTCAMRLRDAYRSFDRPSEIQGHLLIGLKSHRVRWMIGAEASSPPLLLPAAAGLCFQQDG